MAKKASPPLAWLERLLSPPGKMTPPGSHGGLSHLPSLDLRERKLPSLFSMPQKGKGENGILPVASIVYGVASAVLFAIGFYFMFSGLVATGFFVLLPALALWGLAIYYIRFAS